MKDNITSFFASRLGIILTGGIIGILGPVLQKLGNPPNMGICVACFERDIAGALGLHRNAATQYIRPEIIGFVLGSMIAALLFKEFRARGGSAPLIRFALGFFAMIGALAFLGCPWRANFRLAGGDLTAIPGILGLVGGISIGIYFLRNGYSLGRSRSTPAFAGWVLPLFMVLLLTLLIFQPVFAEGGPIFNSEKGPGSLHAALGISLGVGLLIGFLAQRTRFCTMGAFRDAIMIKDFHLLSGIIALLVAAFITNLLLGQFKLGYAGQPIAHSNLLWNILGMVLAGLAYTLAGGCPGRQLFLSGEGDGDASILFLG
ncbi:MAG TPA: YedE family putative selenium transporter [Bellilinea sp.]|nr:YedE family putative selenium transporter [Bellilinea sp.]